MRQLGLTIHVCVSAALIMSVVGVLPGLAQTADVQSQEPLATKQQIVHDRMAQLEDRMFRLVEKLGESQPEQARQLEHALRSARELLIRRNMNETMGLLEERKLTDATDRQLVIMQNLEQVLKILLSEPDHTKDRQKEIDRLRDFAERIDKLVKEQQELKKQVDACGSAKSGKPASDMQKKLAEAGQKQQGLQKKTDQLAKQMQGKDQAEGAQQKPAPGGGNVQQASGHMKDAAGDLDKKKAPEAGKDQQKAIEQLERAKQELNQALDQLTREQQAETLRRLESRFRLMLTRQLAVNASTGELDSKGREAWTHGDELALAGLVKEEKNLADQAAQALQILKEDGTTIIFPRIVGQLRSDMLTVAQHLSIKDTGSITQGIETEIVATLKELIGAMKQLRKECQAGGSSSKGGSGKGKKPPLVPDSAELKLLLLSQQRVNRQTAELHKSRNDSDKLEANQQRELARIANRQQELAEITRQMNERSGG